jgi:hypothetical protein
MALVPAEHRPVMIEKLSHTNYFILKIKLEKLLSRNDLFNVVTGAESRPEEDDEELKDWQIKDAKAMCDIFLDYGDS